MDKVWHLGALTGNSLLAHDGEIGTVKEVYFDDLTWTVRYFVVRLGGPMTGANVVADRVIQGLTRPT